jgi:hypothetical protein
VAVGVALDPFQLGQVVGIDAEHDAFGDDRDPVAPSVGEALDDRSHQRVHEDLELDLLPCKLLGDEGEGGARRLADAEGQVAGLPAHGDHEVPARGGLGVHHQVLHDVDPDVARGLETEGVHVCRQVEVVVDGLGHVHHVDAAARFLLELHRGEGGVVSPDGQEHVDVQAEQRDDRVLEVLGVLGGVGARDPDVGPAAEVDAAHLLDGERG